MAPFLLNHSGDHPHLQQGLWPHTQARVPPSWAWPGPCPRPNQNYIPPWTRAVSPAKLSSVSTRPGLIPMRGRNPLKKKGAAGIDKFKVCPPGPPAACTRLSSFLIILLALTAQFHFLSSKGAEIPSPLASICLPPPTQTRALGLPGPTQGQRPPRGQVPLQKAAIAWPPLGPCGNCQRNSPHHSSPQDLASSLTFLVLVPQPPRVSSNSVISSICPLRP